MATDRDLLRVLLVVVAVIVLIPVLLMAVMMPMMGMWGWGHMPDGGWGTAGGGWLWLLMWLLMLAVVGGIAYLLYRGIRRSADSVSDPALEELRTAYARGDLSDEEYEERRDRLRRE